MRHVEILGRERRRRWSDAGKVAMLERVGVDGRTVANVAREADLTRQHIYQWRKELRRKGLWPTFGLPVARPFLCLLRKRNWGAASRRGRGFP